MYARAAGAVLPVCAFTFLSILASPVSATALLRSVDVNGTPEAVWSVIGGFCAVKDWHPAVGTCILDGKSPQTRTLVTKDGKATFIETQTAYNNADHLYSYTFKSSPLPVTRYYSTLKVVPKTKDISSVTWSSTFTPDKGKETDVSEALLGIYDAGLDAIRSKFIK